MSEPVIEVTDLTFDYPGFRALDGVSLSIAPGSVTALVGPNGAGKTTLLRCIAALDTPLAGTVRVNGLDVYESPREAHRLMGYLSDNFGLYSDLTVAQGLEYAARSQGLTATAVPQAVYATAQRMGLGDKLGNLASALSRGQRQRLAIGQAIIHAPRVLLLDEPASGLDPEARGALADVFKALQAQGMSLLVSSHILAELDEYSTHMLALNHGRVLEHRALNPLTTAAGGLAMERMLRLEFVESTESIAVWLQGQAHVRLVRTEGHIAEIGFGGSRAEQAALVGACIAAGHALVGIASITENLQQSYLKSLAAERATTKPATRMQP
ncbi:MAG: ABC transporter ATP-binding protein [Pseudomonadota bacterium]